MAKPTVYLDTSIISAYCYEGADDRLSQRRTKTRDWWFWERRHFDIWTSAIVEAELREGVFSGQDNCIRAVRRCRYLQFGVKARSLRDSLLSRKIVPPQEPEDAAHLALCSVHSIDYLLTWNRAHIANKLVQKRSNELCRQVGMRAPILVSPEMIPQIRLGQTIRRRK